MDHFGWTVCILSSLNLKPHWGQILYIQHTQICQIPNLFNIIKLLLDPLQFNIRGTSQASIVARSQSSAHSPRLCLFTLSYFIQTLTTRVPMAFRPDRREDFPLTLSYPISGKYFLVSLRFPLAPFIFNKALSNFDLICNCWRTVLSQFCWVFI